MILKSGSSRFEVKISVKWSSGLCVLLNRLYILGVNDENKTFFVFIFFINAVCCFSLFLLSFPDFAENYECKYQLHLRLSGSHLEHDWSGKCCFKLVWSSVELHWRPMVKHDDWK